MSSPVQGPPPGGNASIKPVSPNPYRLRTGRIVLIGEGVLLVVLGVWGLLANLSDPGPDPTGAPVAVLHLTMLHAVVLLATGVGALACAWRRRAALAFIVVQGVGYLLLFTIGLGAAGREKPTALGFDYADAVLHGALMIIALGLGMWLAGQTLEGRWWVPRRGAQRQRAQR